MEVNSRSTLTPKPLQLSWKDWLFSWQFQSLSSKTIQQCLQSIRQRVEGQRSQVLRQLDDPQMWQNLHAQLPGEQQLGALHLLWQRVAPLAHLETKDLIYLLQEPIPALEKAFFHIAQELSEDQSELDLLPDFMRLSRQDVMAQLHEQVNESNNLKELVIQGLMFRALIHKWIDLQPRQMDDVTATFVMKINQWGLLNQPLRMPVHSTATLNDDRRIIIYEIMKKWGTVQMEPLGGALLPGRSMKAILDDIIRPIQNRIVPVLRETSDIRADNQATEQFTQSVIDALAVMTPSRWQFNVNLEWLSDRTLPNWLKGVWRLAKKARHLLVIALSMALYSWLSTAITPLAVLPFGHLIVAGISVGLYLGLIILPVALLAAKGIRVLMTHSKRHEIAEALGEIKDTQRFMSEQLSVTPLDVAHFDAPNLIQQIQYHRQIIRQRLQSLGKMNVVKAYFCQGNICAQITRLESKFREFDQQLTTLSGRFASYIAKRMDTEIELDELNPELKGDVLCMSNAQIRQLRDFVQQFGDAPGEDITQFDVNVNVLQRWVKALPRLFRYERPSGAQSEKPWGLSQPQQSALDKWQDLISTFIVDNTQRRAAEQINLLLKGEQLMTLDELQQRLARLPNGQTFLAPIQDYLYASLGRRSPQIAALLSAQQKERIARWYQNNAADIEVAERSLAKETDFSSERAVRYYQLLDGLQYYQASVGAAADPMARPNQVRVAIDNYTGESATVLRLLNCIQFLPAIERIAIKSAVLKKRLNWFMEHVAELDLSKLFAVDDIFLFQGLDNDDFSFVESISQSRVYTTAPYQAAMLKFMQIIQAHGWADLTNLIVNYERRKPGATYLPGSQSQNRQSAHPLPEEHDIAQPEFGARGAYGL